MPLHPPLRSSPSAPFALHHSSAFPSAASPPPHTPILANVPALEELGELDEEKRKAQDDDHAAPIVSDSGLPSVCVLCPVPA